MVPSYFQNTKRAQDGQGNTTLVETALWCWSLRFWTAAEVVFFFLGKRPISHKTDISVITNQPHSWNRTALYLNLLIMDNHNDNDHDEILSEFWCTNTPCLFNMSASGFSMQQTPHHSQYFKFLLNIVINHIFYRYFLKILVILSSPPFYSAQIKPPKVGDPVPNYILNNSKFFHFLRMPLEPLMVLISMYTLLLLRCLAWLQWCSHHQCSHYTYAISICNFSTSKVAGKGLWPMLWCSMIHVLLISLYPMENIFLQMLCSLLAPPSLFYIMAHNIILLSGVMAQLQYVLLLYYFLLFSIKFF